MNPSKHIEDYLEWMVSKGYTESTIRAHKNALCRFQRFLENSRIPWEESFETSVLISFRKAKGPWVRLDAVKGMGRYLFSQGVIGAPFQEPHPALAPVYEDYLFYFKNTRGVQDKYLKDARSLLAAFCQYLEKHSIELCRIKIEHVDAFLSSHNSHHSISTRRRSRSHLRNFFKYLYYDRRIIKRDLAPLIVGATVFAQAKPPKFLRPRELEQVFEQLCVDSQKGLRQAAMVHLAFTLGLRPKEVSLIRLDDISFTRGTIKVPIRKADNPITLPLPEATIKVIAAYLIGARPKSEHRQLFLELIAPYDPVKAATVGSDITAALKRVNPQATAYWLRHTYARNMLYAGATLFEVKEMLGHDCIQSTRRYLHIDLNLMRGLFDE